MARQPRRGLRRFLTRRVLISTVFVLTLLLAGFITYMVLLDRQIVRQFEGRRWDLPAQVYARPLEIYVGLRLSLDELQNELLALGYASTKAAESQGTFARLAGRISLQTRPFQFWDGRQPVQAAVVTFQGNQVTALTDARGRELPLLRLDPPFIGNIFTAHGEDRVIVGPDEVPDLLLDTLKVVEDRDFDRHRGVSLRAISRALWANVKAGGIEQGGSTLTQQLVKSYFLDNRRTLSRKIREALMAVLLELHFDKADLLYAYVNEIYLGQAGERAIHGFGLASQFYFGRPLAELEPQEIALLVAIVRGPSYYDPRRNAERAQKRRDMVLDLMAEFGVIEAAVATSARARELGIRRDARSFSSYNPTFMDLVRRELQADYPEEALQSAGLRIMTTLDPRIQTLAEEQLTNSLAELEKFRKKDSAALDGAIVVTGAQSADVVAIVGGRNSRFRGFNRALDARRPIGSLVKPVVFLAALESGRYAASTTIDDAPITVKLDTGQTWSPQNYDRQYRGPVPAVRALAESLNTPTVRIGMDVTPRRVAELMQALGLDRVPAALPSLLLGSVDLSPLEVAQIYNSLANGGFNTPLKAVRAVLDADGEPLERYRLNISRGADPTAVVQLNAMLTQVVARGTGGGARRWLPPGMTVAGKTGTSDDLRDSWFAGFSNDHVAVVWVGADDNSPTGLTGASGALPLWARLVAGLGDLPYDPPMAPGLVEMRFDFATGMTAREDCGQLVVLPLPAGTDLPRNPACEPLSENLAEQGMRWLRDLLD